MTRNQKSHLAPAANTEETAGAAGSKLKTTPIAVIGMGSLLPEARSTQQYWDNIMRKIDTIMDVPSSRWSIEDYYDPDPTTPDKTYCKRGAFLPDIDFDPMEFGLPPNILEVTDVSQLLALVVARDALEDAGYGESRTFNRESTGVVLGAVGMSSKLFTPLMNRLQYPVWGKVLRSAGVSEADTQKIIEKIKLAYVGWEENAFPGAIGNVIAGRICNRFDLGGTNCVVDAACASSLAAVRMAVAELIEGRADMMITGGVDADNTINTYMCFSKTPAFTKGDRVRTFDAESGGMMVGEGVGMIVLKRLEDAERDGDRIYAVIKAIGTSSDGRFKSIYAPRPAGQAKALRRAYAEAGFSPHTVGLVEAHGTGTNAGDPAEFQGLNEVFSEDNPHKGYIALGSVKSMIGHTKAAAGVASLIKTSLALHHKVLPATINVTRPNPKFGIENTPFYINTETRPWIRAKSGHPRRAGVSSFGFGGTNFHVVLEEYSADHQGAYRQNTVAQPVLLSAETPAQLLAACRETMSKLEGDGAAYNFANLAESCRGLEIPQAHARVGFVAETAEEARAMLQICVDNLSGKPNEESWEHPKGIFYRKSGLEAQGKLVALFSGQGSQYLEMGRELALNFPTVRDVFANLDDLFIADGLEPLSTRVYPRPVFDQKERDALSDMLTRTDHAQPAIGAISVGLYKLLQESGFVADFVAGHSFGELTALWASGVLSDLDYYTLAKARGKAMAPPEDPSFDAGTMVAVKGDVEKVQDALKNDPEVTLANWNSNDQVVIAGSKPAMARASKTLTDLGFKTIPLTVSAAFHTPLVGHAQKPFAKAVRSVTFNAPKVKVYSNSTGQAHAGDPESIRGLLEKHILNPVRFRDEINNIYAAGGSIFVEFGPKNVLTNLVDNILAGKPHTAVALNANAKKDSDRQLREAVMALRVAGLPLKNFDPYAVPRMTRAPKKKSPVTVKINGGFYITEKTRSAFDKALNDGWKISQAAPAAPAAPASAAVSVPAPAQVAAPAPAPQAAPASPVAAETVESLLSEYQSHQAETLRLHEQYLRTEEEYARAFAQLTQLQTELVSKGSANPGELSTIVPLFESLERSMTRFHDHQAETLRIHQRYLETQEKFSQSFVGGLQAGVPAAAALPAASAPRPVTPAPAPVTVAPVSPKNGSGSNGSNGVSSHAFTPAARESKPVSVPTVPTPAVPAVSAPAPSPLNVSSLSAPSLQTALLSIVSEKTGYPVETLELDMDMEADLGIDSIKRVEILGAMQTQFPELPKIETNVLAELRTLGQIIQEMSQSAPAASAASAPAAPAPAVSSAAAVQSAASISADTVKNALLGIVSEKTGYPVETLELDMDMEADLGIDSIKRVEILGAMQAQFPELPKIETNVLAELRTLGQIIDQMSVSSPETTVVTRANAAAESVQQVVDAPAASPSASTLSASSLNTETLKTALLSIVSEKTGYPVETLEMDMDMEADLGIDSIKRVEILGALQAQFPELPKTDAAVLAELRTLGQIVDSFSAANASGAAGSTAAAAPSAEVTAQSPFDGAVSSLPAVEETALLLEAEPYDSGIQQGMVVRKLLPSPDQMDFDLPAGHVCLVTDDGALTTTTLVEALLARNWPVVLLRMPVEVLPERASLPAGAAAVDLPDLSETTLETALTTIGQQYGPVAVFIYLAPSNLAGGGEPAFAFPEGEKALLKLIFLAAKHLKSTLNDAAQKGRAAFMTVTRLDGEFGLSEGADFTPISGGLFGLTKTVNLEWDAVFCRALDLSPALDTARAVGCILAELNDPNRLVIEVGYTESERSTLALATIPVSGTRTNIVPGGK